MSKSIHYTTLMHEQNVVGQGPVRFSQYCDGDSPELLDDGLLFFLFVLQGELAVTFNDGRTTTLSAAQMMVVDKFQIRELKCVGDTVVLECVESDSMSPLMQAVSAAFDMPYSEVITINSKLKAWCMGLFADMTGNNDRDNDYYHDRCSEFTALLLEYPKSVLGALYVPLYTCSTNCEKCPRLFVQNRGILE